jgi:hypothetical protein
MTAEQTQNATVFDKSDLVRTVLDVAIRKLCRAFEFEYDPDVMPRLEADGFLISSLNKNILKNDIFHTREYRSIYQFSVYRNLLYYLVRKARPEIVVETGVFHGLTSMWILKALHDNGTGRLISIDLPRREWARFFPGQEMGPGHQDEDELPDDVDPGWIIPDELKERWELLIGPSSHHLESVLDKNTVDLFIHDSDHSYENLKFELEASFAKAPDALVVADNFDMNHFVFEHLGKNDFGNMFIDDVDDWGDIRARAAVCRRRASESSHDRWQRQLEARKARSAEFASE